MGLYSLQVVTLESNCGNQLELEQNICTTSEWIHEYQGLNSRPDVTEKWYLRSSPLNLLQITVCGFLATYIMGKAGGGCYRQNVCVSPKFICDLPISSLLVLGGVGFGRWLGHEGRTLMNGISECPYKRDLRKLPFPFHHVRVQWEDSSLGTCLVVLCLRICLAMQHMWVRSLVRALRSHVPQN